MTATRPTRQPHRATLVFAAAVALLVVLSLWWMVFFHRSVHREHEQAMQALRFEAQLQELKLRAQLGGQAPPAGVIGQDPRFVVVVAAKTNSWRVAPSVASLAQVQRHHDRQRVMLLGEGILLTGLLLAVMVMLFRLVRAERRFRDEMETFLSRVTHEMKTPLAGIKAVLQVLASERVAPDATPDLARRALREVDREQQLIENLLLAQRIRLPQGDLLSEDVDIVALTDRLVQHRNSLAGAGASFSHEGAGVMIAHVDPSALRSVLDNLFDNAAKYGATTVSVEVKSTGLEVAIVVADNGRGFDSEQAETLFEPFRRGDSGGPQGTGLGLHISRTLARQMGGDVHAHSDGVGCGARFRLTLPLAHPA